MAYIRLTLASRCLNGATDVSVFFPDDPKAPIGIGMAPRKPGVIPGDAVDKSRRYQVLWLMHGGGDDYTAWPLDAMVQRACGSEQLIVVMPTIRDLPGVARNADYLSYLTEELPELIGFLFPISRRRHPEAGADDTHAVGGRRYTNRRRRHYGVGAGGGMHTAGGGAHAIGAGAFPRVPGRRAVAPMPGNGRIRGRKKKRGDARFFGHRLAVGVFAPQLIAHIQTRSRRC